MAADTDRGMVRWAVDASALPINCSILPCCTWMTPRRGIRKIHAPIPPRRAGAVRGPCTLSKKHCASVQLLKSAREDEHPSVLCVSLFLCPALHISFALLSTATTLRGKSQKIKIRSPTRNHTHARTRTYTRTCTRTRMRAHPHKHHELLRCKSDLPRYCWAGKTCMRSPPRLLRRCPSRRWRMPTRSDLPRNYPTNTHHKKMPPFPPHKIPGSSSSTASLMRSDC